MLMNHSWTLVSYQCMYVLRANESTGYSTRKFNIFRMTSRREIFSRQPSEHITDIMWNRRATTPNRLLSQISIQILLVKIFTNLLIMSWNIWYSICECVLLFEYFYNDGVSWDKGGMGGTCLFVLGFRVSDLLDLQQLKSSTSLRKHKCKGYWTGRRMDYYYCLFHKHQCVFYKL